MTAAQKFGEILKQKRKEKKLSQIGLAIIAYKKPRFQSFISRVESGSYKDLKFEDVTIILEALDVDLISIIEK